MAFRNIQYIPVPFVLAVDMFPTSDNVGLSVSTTGSYVVFPFADDPFNYPSGFIQWVSGSGSWQGSGFTLLQGNYVYDNFNYYLSGFTTGFYLSGIQTSGYITITPLLYSGFNTNGNNYVYETFNYYPTGLTTFGFLQSGFDQSGYNLFFPDLYSGLFNFLAGLQSGAYIYHSTDLANTGLIWSGSGININPGGMPYLQATAPNSLASKQQGGTGGMPPYGGPYYAGGPGNVPYPWTGGGPVLEGNIIVNSTVTSNAAGTTVNFTSGAFVSLSGFGSGVITGDFTINIFWNWQQNLTPNSNNSWAAQAPNLSVGQPQTFGNLTGIGIGIGTSPQVGQVMNNIPCEARATVGGPQPDALNFGPNYHFHTFYDTFPSFPFSTPYVPNINQDTVLVDYDFISGFGLCVYTTIWSGATWTGPNSGLIQGQYPFGLTLSPNFYTGMTSGLMSNVYAFVLGNKISGNLPSALPTALMTATGVTAFTGNFIKYQPLSTGNYSATGWWGASYGTVANGPMAQFTGFGLGIAQYLTLTRTGGIVSLYQSGLLYATGWAPGTLAIPVNGNKTLPLIIGKSNRPTGVFDNSYSGFGLFHFDAWNTGLNAAQIQNFLLTYNNPTLYTGVTGLLSWQNFLFN